VTMLYKGWLSMISYVGVWPRVSHMTKSKY
jgi:hypothetical protein